MQEGESYQAVHEASLQPAVLDCSNLTSVLIHLVLLAGLLVHLFSQSAPACIAAYRDTGQLRHWHAASVCNCQIMMAAANGQERDDVDTFELLVKGYGTPLLSTKWLEPNALSTFTMQASHPTVLLCLYLGKTCCSKHTTVDLMTNVLHAMNNVSMVQAVAR